MYQGAARVLEDVLTRRGMNVLSRSRMESVSRDGDVMPQKSTYFYPKALTGLVINPLEW